MNLTKGKRLTTLIDNIMKTILSLFIFITVISIPNEGNAQKTPNWTKASYRSAKYPAATFITGYAHDIKSKDESIADATERIKNMATGNLAKNIITTIKTVSKNHTQSIEYKNNEELKQTFESQTQSETNAQINGIKTLEYHNPKTDHLYAFAYANRYEVIGYYKANINMHLQQIKGFISAAKEFARTSEKIEAEKEYLKTIPLFAKIEYAQGLLLALDKNANESSVKIKESTELRNSVVQALSELKQGIYVHIDVSASLFGTSTDLLENKLKAELAVNKCSFVQEKSKADWLITIIASSRKGSNAHGLFFSYVDATISLKKAYNNKHVYQDEIKQKGGSGNGFKPAAKKAFESIAPKIAKNLLKWINS